MRYNLESNAKIFCQFLAIGLFGAILTMTAPSKLQAAYPDKPLKFFIPHFQGGGSDRTVRLYLPFLGKHLGSKIAAINKPGGGNAVGMSALAKSDADGYSIGLINLPHLMVTQIVSKTPYSNKSFAFIGSINADSTSIYVKKSSPYKTIQDLINAGKENPGKISIGNAGLRAHGIPVFKLQSATGAKFNIVPIKGGGRTRKAVLGGHAPVGAQSLGSIAKYHGKQLRALVHFNTKRMALAPDVPTAKESGIDYTYQVIRSIAAPQATPKNILEKLRTAHKAAMNDPAWIKAAKKRRIPVDYMTGEEVENIANGTFDDIKTTFTSVPQLNRMVKRKK